MLNVDELENKHKNYKLKSYTPYLVILLGVSAAIVSISFFVLYDFNSKTETKKELTAQSYKEDVKPGIVTKNEDEALKQEAANIVAVEEKTKEPKEEEKLKLSPSLNFIKRIESEVSVSKKEESTKAVGVVEQKVEKPIKKSEEATLPIIEEIKESIVVVEKPVSTRSIINIKKRDDEEDIKHVIKRFNINHNPALSLFAAKKYYQLGDYEQSYNYSLITNDINNNIEESWIIFSKSLVKLDKKNKAIETLKKYISYSDSSQARQLLDEILSGKFK